jgi:hypothetical protein
VFDEILVEWDRYILVEWDRYIYVEVLCEKISNAFPINAIKIYDEVKDQWIDKPKDDKGKTPHHIKKLKVNDQPNLREMIKERNHKSSIQTKACTRKDNVQITEYALQNKPLLIKGITVACLEFINLLCLQIFIIFHVEVLTIEKTLQ